MNAVAEVSIDACVWWESRVGKISKYSIPSLSDSVKLQNYEQSCNTCNKMRGQKCVFAPRRHHSSLEFTPLESIIFYAIDSMHKYCMSLGVKEANGPGRGPACPDDDEGVVTRLHFGAFQGAA